MHIIWTTIPETAVSASWLILAVLILRQLLKKAPKWITCLLWSLVALRLILPFQVETAFGLAPRTDQITAFLSSSPASEGSGPEAPSDELLPSAALESPLPAPPQEDVDLLTVSGSYNRIPVILWAAGASAMLLYMLLSYMRLKYRLKTATLLKGKIKQSEYVNSPFILGLLKPWIYIPYHMDQETLEHVLMHEEAHLRHRDHWLKVLAFLLLSVYWFHPLVWIAYILFCRDTELACDEYVISDMEPEERKRYARALVDCHCSRRFYFACPVGFGETNIRERIRRILSYRQPALGILLLCVILCAVTAACLLTSPARSGSSPDTELSAESESSAGLQLPMVPVPEAGSPSPARIPESGNSASGSENGTESGASSAASGNTAVDGGAICGISPDDVFSIRALWGWTGETLAFSRLDSNTAFLDLLTLCGQLDGSGASGNSSAPNSRIGYQYALKLYASDGSELLSVTPYKDGFAADGAFYPCDDPNGPPLQLWLYMDNLFHPADSASSDITVTQEYLQEVHEKITKAMINGEFESVHTAALMEDSVEVRMSEDSFNDRTLLRELDPSGRAVRIVTGAPIPELQRSSEPAAAAARSEFEGVPEPARSIK